MGVCGGAAPSGADDTFTWADGPGPPRARIHGIRCFPPSTFSSFNSPLSPATCLSKLDRLLPQRELALSSLATCCPCPPGGVASLPLDRRMEINRNDENRCAERPCY
ncbi:hypothetical protein NL676_027523 [Syzygium grande]|nr:hypothetical protein NL676_027523 [Syzygium grande]